MDDALDGFVGLLLILVGFLVIITLVAGWEILKLCRQLLVWLYEAIQPLILEAWTAWQQRRWEAAEPAEIQRAGEAARDEIDQIMAEYRRQVDGILKTKGISLEPYPDVILLTEQDYHPIQEDAYVTRK